MRIAIAGSGLMGRVLAYEALQQNWDVTLFEKDTTTGKKSCGYSAAGLLAPIAELSSEDSHLIEIGRFAINYWSTLHKKLAEVFFFQQLGTLCIAHTQDQPDFHRFREFLIRKGAQEFLDFQLLAPQQIESDLSQSFQYGIYLPNEAQIDPISLFTIFTKIFREKNLAWHTQQFVEDLGQGYIKTRDRKWYFDWVFDCRGLGAKNSLANLRGIRGELICLLARDVYLQRPIRLIHPRYPIYIIPRPKHIYLIGASQIDCEDQSSISVQTTLELLSAAFSIHPGFAEARILKNVVNCRPSFADHLPRIIFKKQHVQINGLYRHGYLYAPFIATELIKFLKNIPTSKKFLTFLAT